MINNKSEFLNYNFEAISKLKFSARADGKNLKLNKIKFVWRHFFKLLIPKRVFSRGKNQRRFLINSKREPSAYLTLSSFSQSARTLLGKLSRRPSGQGSRPFMDGRESEAESKRKFLAGKFDSVFSNKVLAGNSSFTLIELLIVIAIFSVIIALTFSNLFGKRQATDLSAAKQEIVALLREAQSRAANQDGGKNWGVYFGNPASSTSFFSLYSSSSYAGSAIESHPLPSDLGYSLPPSASSTDINFSQITGLPGQSATIGIYVISNPAESSTIIVATSGAISY
jgi:prepilin-type N-terminal cleavage/methylation domain-containing protein